MLVNAGSGRTAELKRFIIEQVKLPKNMLQVARKPQVKIKARLTLLNCIYLPFSHVADTSIQSKLIMILF